MPNLGGLIVSTSKVRGAYIYDFRISTNADLPVDQWKGNPSKMTKYAFTGLESAKRYYVCMGVLDATNAMVYSEPISYVTQ